MEMSSSKLWRYGLLTVSIFISIIDVAFLSFGVVTWGGATYETAAWIVAIIGSLLLALSFGGCFVSLRESFTSSLIFCGAALLFVLVQIIYVVTYAIMEDDIIELSALRVQQAWSDEQRKPGAMRIIEIQYYCCGMEGPQDYEKAVGDATLPESCCWGQDCSNKQNIFERGCGSAAVELVNDQSYYFIWSNVGLIFLYLLGAICSYYHGKRFENVEKKSDEIVINE